MNVQDVLDNGETACGLLVASLFRVLRLLLEDQFTALSAAGFP